MRALICVWLLLAFAAETVLAAHTEVTVTLARDGEPAATIVIAKEPTRAAHFAACEL
jgi:hypothetical protein